jgi:hypothetical protein
MERLNRKRGPEVWQFRWSEINPSGKRLYHKKIVGTVEQYSDETAVRRAVVGLLSEINTDVLPTNPRAITIAQLCDHFEQRELSTENTCAVTLRKRSKDLQSILNPVGSPSLAEA